MEDKIENEKEETQDMLKDIWWNLIRFQYPECSDEEADKIFDYGVKFLDVIAKLALEEMMQDEKKEGCHGSSFRQNMFNSISELLDTCYDNPLYKTWRSTCDQEGRVEMEMRRDD